MIEYQNATIAAASGCEHSTVEEEPWRTCGKEVREKIPS